MRKLLRREAHTAQGDGVYGAWSVFRAVAIVALATLALAVTQLAAAAQVKKSIKRTKSSPEEPSLPGPVSTFSPSIPPAMRVAPPMPPPVLVPPAPPSPPSFPVSVTVKGEPLTDPTSWATDADYPSDALRDNQQGRVSIGLYIDPQGKPDRCIVIYKSGSPSLDQASCQVAMMRARFKPALAPDGTPTGFLYTTSMNWRLEDDLDFDVGTKVPDVSKGPILRTLARTIIDVDADGKGIACRSGTAAIPDDDACGNFSTGRRMIPPVKLAGKAVPATITLTRSVRVEVKPQGK